MRKTSILLLLLLCSLSGLAQKPGKHVYLPGKGHLDVEQFIRPINTKMDLSPFSAAELRVLRNAVVARKGFLFKDADLRAIFSQTSWYDSLVWERFDAPMESQPEYHDYTFFNGYSEYEQQVRLTPEERAFVRKIQERERRLHYQSDKVRPATWRFAVDDMLNPFQLDPFPEVLKDALGRNGFAIVPGKKIQLFHVYEKNDYADFPSFVTTDLYLQLFHLYFDFVLRNLEEQGLSKLLKEFCEEMYRKTDGYNQSYFAIALSLLTDEPLPAVDDSYRQEALREVEKVKKASDDFSEYLDYRDVMFSYSLFRPRGHYTRSESLSRYFRAMMWLQTVPFGTDKPRQLQCALQMAQLIGSDARLRQCYERLSMPMTFLFGKPDNITIMQVYEEIEKADMPLPSLLKNKKAMQRMRQRLDTLGDRQTRIRPKFELSSHTKINLLPQRYMPDAEVLNELIDSKNDPTRRGCPQGLDVFAAMGRGCAEKILIGELSVQEAWGDYLPTLGKMKQRMQETDWTETIATRWMQALSIMQDTVYNGDQWRPNDNTLPRFMRTDQWMKKNLNTALASWAELKHDAILYAKQPMGAECGAGGPPDPVVKGFVEPNIPFWKRAVALQLALSESLDQHGLTTERIKSVSNRMEELTVFLLSVAQKCLSPYSRLTDEEYKQLEIIGSTVENLSLDLVREPDQYLDGWDNVQGADRSIACIADVYTANGFNNPDKSILYEAVGPAYEIYVVVEIDGEKYLTRGAVFSYREFNEPLGSPRLTDEEWQQQLKERPYKGVPEWMKEIIVPLEGAIQDNEEFFYSSGC